MPICFCSFRPNSNETRVPNIKAEVFQRTKTKRKGFCVQNENKNEKGVITLEKMLYISLDFSPFPLIFPPFIGIDHLENVSMRYRYPKVLGYRVLGIDIDPALARTTDLVQLCAQTTQVEVVSPNKTERRFTPGVNTKTVTPFTLHYFLFDTIV